MLGLFEIFIYGNGHRGKKRKLGQLEKAVQKFCEHRAPGRSLIQKAKGKAVSLNEWRGVAHKTQGLALASETCGQAGRPPASPSPAPCA